MVRLFFYFWISFFGFVIRRRKISLWAMRNWFTGCCNGLKINSSLHHKENLDTHAKAVFIANHMSSLDIFIIGTHLRHDYRWLAKSALFKTPLLGWHLYISGHIPVYRGKKRYKNKLLNDKIHKAVTQGASLFFFPEGTRSKDGNLKAFKKGAFVTAMRENLPIIPLVLKGTGALMKKASWDLDVDESRKCTVTVLPAIDPAPFMGDVDKDLSPEERIQRSAEKLRDYSHQVFQKALGEEETKTG